MERHHYYFIGIAGQVMSGLAAALKRQGHQVEGVAVGAYPPATDALKAAGIHYYTRYDAGHIQPGMRIVVGRAIELDNPEVKAADKLKLPMLSFPKLLGEIRGQETRVVVAGTHGKTTTTTLIAWLLESVGRHPDFVIGMSGKNFGQSVRLEGSEVMVMEGDEYAAEADDPTSKFLYYHPDVVVITSLEWDHPDLFPTYEAMEQSFVKLLAGQPADGLVVASADDLHVVDLVKKLNCRAVWYGLQADDGWQARNIQYQPHQTQFDVYSKGEFVVQLTSPLAGEHNVKNVLAGLAVMDYFNISPARIASGLLSFAGPSRRFETVGVVNDVTVIDDYAHHPTEVAATLAGAKARFAGSRIWAYFTPHTYSRTASLLPEYQHAFDDATFVVLGELDPAREAGQPATVSSMDIERAINRQDGTVHVIENPVLARQFMVDNAEPGDVMVCMTVGTLDSFTARLVEALEQRWAGG